MIVRVMLIFLLAIALLGMLGKWRRRRVPPKPARRAIEAAHKCPNCGAWVLAGETCPCTRG